MANFTVASTPHTFDKQTNEWKDGDALFLRCAAWRQLAENVAESLQKGQRVIVTGALRVRQFERQDGSKGTSVELNVDGKRVRTWGGGIVRSSWFGFRRLGYGDTPVVLATHVTREP